MDKYQAQATFWNSFNCPAYEVNSVPDQDDLTFPYITYEMYSNTFNGDVTASASVWSRSTSWLTADTITNAIETALKDGGQVLHYEGGIIWVTAGNPFAQNMGDPTDDRIKRKRLSVVLHFA